MNWYLLTAFVIFALFVIYNEDNGGDDDQDGGMLQPVYQSSR